MTSAEIIAAAREIVEIDDQPLQAKNEVRFARLLAAKGPVVCRELIHLHDGGQWSSEPPTEPGLYWFKYEEAAKPYYIHVQQKDNGELYMIAGSRNYICLLPRGFWIGPISPADAATLAELRAEVERYRKLAFERYETIERLNKYPSEDWKSCGELSCDECDGRALSLLRDRDRLQAELAEARKEVERIRADRDKIWALKAFKHGQMKMFEQDRDRLSAELADCRRQLAAVTAERDAALAGCPWENNLDTTICPVHKGPIRDCPLTYRGD